MKLDVVRAEEIISIDVLKHALDEIIKSVTTAVLKNRK